MSTPYTEARGQAGPTPRGETHHLLLSALLHWPYSPDQDCPSVLLVSPSGNGKSHLVHSVVRAARGHLQQRHVGATDTPDGATATSSLATSSSTMTDVVMVAPSLVEAVATQQRDGSTGLRTVVRRAVLAELRKANVAKPSHSPSSGPGAAAAWSVLVHLDHVEHFLGSDGDATVAGQDGGDDGADRAENVKGGDGAGVLGAFSPYPTLLADLYAVLHGCPPLFSREECTALGLRRLVFVSSFSGENGDVGLHPFARAKLFDVVSVLDTPTEAERDRFFRAALGSSGGSDDAELGLSLSRTASHSAGLDALTQRTGGLTYAGLVEVVDAWWQLEDEQVSDETAVEGPDSATQLCVARAHDTVSRFRRSGTVAALQCRRSAGYVDVQTTHWDDIAGMDSVKAQLQAMVTRPLQFYAQYARRGVRHSTGVLLHGPPGTGKTMLAKAMATELNASFIYVDLPELVQAEVGESERKLKAFFDVARQRSPALIFMDELQAAFGVRYTDPAGAGRGGGAAHLTAGSSHDARLVSHLLQLLDSAQEDTSHLIIFVGATNVVHLLDPLLLRPGRLDTHLAVPLPDEAARRSLASRVVLGEWRSWFLTADGTPVPQRDVVQQSLVDLFVAASPEMSGAELRNAMSVFALQLMQTCLPQRHDALPDTTTSLGDRLVHFLLRSSSGDDCVAAATGFGAQAAAEAAADSSLKVVFSDAALQLAQEAFTTGQS